jgi:predicted regulator of Ras-like GTPase activity (Roadblock/LC7/MglB family)
LQNIRLSDNRKRCVKEPQTLEPASAAAASLAAATRYRHPFSPPATVSLRLADIASQIPEAARLPAFDAELRIDLPCRDVFAGPVPKLPLSRLAQIASQQICPDGIPDFVILLPVTQLALAYRFVGGRELLTDDGRDSRTSGSDDFAPKAEVSEPSESSVSGKENSGPAASEAMPADVGSAPALAGPDAPAEKMPETSGPPTLEPPAADSPQPQSSIPADLPPSFTQPVVTERAAREPASAVVREAILEHLPQAEPKPTAEIPDQDGLQAIFMTEELLSVNRVVELCGGLPGIRSCVLAHGAAVVASYNVPESIDLVSLSAHALEMLAAMRQSAAQMGIGAVPAVTVHSEKGPITFFHQNDLCLLVLHKDRGFVPGVREKLQQVVVQLSHANIALPVTASRPALTPRQAAF